jgi:hypothetical protein
MSPPPAPMFMPHGASLDASSDELQSPSAAQGPHVDAATPVSARRCVVCCVACVYLCLTYVFAAEAAQAVARRATKMNTSKWTFRPAFANRCVKDVHGCLRQASF